MEPKVDHAEDVLVFKDKKVRLRTNREENLIATLEMVGKWEEKEEKANIVSNRPHCSKKLRGGQEIINPKYLRIYV